MLIRLFKNNKGFTLVELMIVITVIAILATIGTMSFTRVQKQARDTKRKGDLRALSTALQAYYTENNSSYPLTSAGLAALAAAPVFIPSVPVPPGGTTQTAYEYASDGFIYGICALMETQTTALPIWKVSTLNPAGSAFATGTCVAQ